MFRHALLATLVVCALFPALAWAQGYGGSLPPGQPTAIPAGSQTAGPSAIYPPQAPLPYSPLPGSSPPTSTPPGSPSPSDWHPPRTDSPAYPPPQAYPGAPLLPPSQAYPPLQAYPPQNNPPPSYLTAPGPAYPTVRSADGTAEFPALGMPTAGSHWMFSAEAIWLERVDTTGVILGNTVTDYGAGLGYVTDILTSTDVDFPLDAGVRLQAGYRFNDRNAVELTYFGVQQASVGRTIYGDPSGNTILAYSPWTQTDYIIGGFDNSLGYTYGSRVNNAEINQRFTAAAGPTWTLAGLWGVRFVQVADRFNLNGSDLSTGDFENIDIRTTNDLLGPQIGVAWTSFWNRLELTSEVKGGLMANFNSASYSNLNSSGVISGNPAGFYPIDGSAHATDLAGLLEFSLIARYRLAEHFWLRGGYQTYYLAGLALGPRQLASFNHSGSLSLDGPSLGIETNW